MGIFNPAQNSTQDHLDIEDIRDDLVVMKNGAVAAVLETNAMNFELLAEQEQDANIYSFANLLNSLTFSIQIVLRTVSTDISRYVDELSHQQKRTPGALSDQIDIYKTFVTNLTENTNILDKSFYVVVPTRSLEPIKTSGLRQLFGQRQRIVNIDKIVEGAKLELEPKRDHLIKQFNSMGLDAWQLKNDELIKLYYGIYEPDKSGQSKLSISEADIQASLINADQQVETVETKAQIKQ